jgi:hypothetical protein
MGRVRRSPQGQLAHVLYRREALVVNGEAGSGGGNDEFCGIENTISSEELLENEAGVHEVMTKSSIHFTLSNPNLTHC